MSKKHTALRDNIGTYTEEDDAFKLLTTLAWRLPISVATSALLDLVLACVYLKWLHPWKIILQKASQKFPFVAKIKALPKAQRTKEFSALNKVTNFKSFHK